MSQLANITVFDGQATPVTHTLIPEGGVVIENGIAIARWKESLAGVPDSAQMRCTISKRKLGKNIIRTGLRFDVPVMESVSGQNAAGYTAAPAIAYVDSCELVSYAHNRSLVSGRRSARQLVLNWATSLTTSNAAATTGFGPEAVDQLIMPN